jgi:hypothetical protein
MKRILFTDHLNTEILMHLAGTSNIHPNKKCSKLNKYFKLGEICRNILDIGEEEEEEEDNNFSGVQTRRYGIKFSRQSPF